MPWEEWFLPAAGSTMDWARRLTADRGCATDPHRAGGTIDAVRVRVGRQLQGRGRRGAPWWDAPGSAILTTLAVRRTGVWDPGDRNPASMALRAGLAVTRMLEAFGVPEVGIKWPNDIYLGQRKVCGILVEADPRWFYIGIGLNVRAPVIPSGAGGDFKSALPGDLSRPLPPSVGVHSLLALLDHTLAEALLEESWVEAVRNRLLWTDCPVRLERESAPDVSGVLTGIDETGAVLISDHASGEPVCYVAGTLRQGSIP